MMKYLYLLIDFFTVIIPFLFSFHPKIKFYKEWKWFIPANMVTAIIFVIWDIVFTKLGVWGFNERYLLGIYFYNLPIEEILFFICIPYACVFTYYCLNRFNKIKLSAKAEQWIVHLLSFSLLITGSILYYKLYTASVFISLAIILLLIKYFLKRDWLLKLITIYPLLLIPFFIVNGLLTGTGLQDPVVWYNNLENMGLRILTIPIEDIFYGFELILLNVFFYKLFRSTSGLSVTL